MYFNAWFKGPSMKYVRICKKGMGQIEIFIKNEANVNDTDNDRRNALHLFLLKINDHNVDETEYIRLLEIIMNEITDINAVTSTGDSALHIAVSAKNYKACKLLIKGKKFL